VSVFSVPPLEEEPWPSLGWQVVHWMENGPSGRGGLCFGPGDLLGQPLVLDDERKALIYRAYEVYPPDHPNAGRRRFNRVVLSQPKGVGKTEMLSFFVAAELSPSAPVRTIDWTVERGERLPVGGPVASPYIPVVALTEEQSSDLGFAVLLAILERCSIGEEFDAGLERVMRRNGHGKAVLLAAAPDARDGALTTFQVADETHHWRSPRLVQAHRTMSANLPKRKEADAWALETTTAYEPGQGSVAEKARAYAEKVHAGLIHDPKLFYFHRQASNDLDVTTVEGRRAAAIEARGPAASWSNVDAIVAQFDDPSADVVFLDRVWFNRIRQGSNRAFDAARWEQLVRRDYEVPAGALITLGFSGVRRKNATVLVGTEISTGYQWELASWEAPTPAQPGWEVSEAELDAAVADAFKRWDVWRLNARDHSWQGAIDKWAGRYRDEDDKPRVVAWHDTGQWLRPARACQAFAQAIADREVTHDGSARLARHIGAACKRALQVAHDEDPAWTIQKESADAPVPINGAWAAVLSWQARRDALALGVGPQDSVYNQRAEAGEEDVLRWV